MPSALIIGNTDGIGLATTQLLLEQGWQVTGISRRASTLQCAGYRHLVCDVCSSAYASLLATVLQDVPSLEVCVYCVGIGEELDVHTLNSDVRVFETNVLAAVVTAQVLIPAFIRAGSGHFVGLSSQADALVSPVAPSYAASKAALSSYLSGLALACKRHNVYITTLRFGFVDTKLAKSRIRPFMLTREQAARHVWKCIKQRPVRATHPRRMSWLVRCAQFVTWLKLTLGLVT